MSRLTSHTQPVEQEVLRQALRVGDLASAADVVRRFEAARPAGRVPNNRWVRVLEEAFDAFEARNDGLMQLTTKRALAHALLEANDAAAAFSAFRWCIRRGEALVETDPPDDVARPTMKVEARSAELEPVIGDRLGAMRAVRLMQSRTSADVRYVEAAIGGLLRFGPLSATGLGKALEAVGTGAWCVSESHNWQASRPWKRFERTSRSMADALAADPTVAARRFCIVDLPQGEVLQEQFDRAVSTDVLHRPAGALTL